MSDAGARLYLAWLAEEAPDGHSAARAPLHLTLVPPFRAPEATALAAVEEAVAGVAPVPVRVAGGALFGPRRDVPVVLVAPPGRLRELHGRLMSALTARAAGPAGAPHTGEAFTPHISVRRDGPPAPAPGRPLLIDHVALLRTGGGRTTVVARRTLPGRPGALPP